MYCECSGFAVGLVRLVWVWLCHECNKCCSCNGYVVGVFVNVLWMQLVRWCRGVLWVSWVLWVCCECVVYLVHGLVS